MLVPRAAPLTRRKRKDVQHKRKVHEQRGQEAALLSDACACRGACRNKSM